MLTHDTSGLLREPATLAQRQSAACISPALEAECVWSSAVRLRENPGSPVLAGVFARSALYFFLPASLLSQTSALLLESLGIVSTTTTVRPRPLSCDQDQKSNKVRSLPQASPARSCALHPPSQSVIRPITIARCPSWDLVPDKQQQPDGASSPHRRRTSSSRPYHSSQADKPACETAPVAVDCLSWEIIIYTIVEIRPRDIIHRQHSTRHDND